MTENIWYWSYFILPVGGMADEDLHTTLRQLGRDQWELAGIEPGVRYVFKQKNPITGMPPPNYFDTSEELK